MGSQIRLGAFCIGGGPVCDLRHLGVRLGDRTQQDEFAFDHSKLPFGFDTILDWNVQTHCYIQPILTRMAYTS